MSNTEIQTTLQSERYWLLSWLALPVVAVWFAVSYIIGEINVPEWYGPASSEQNQIVQTVNSNWQWDGDGLITLWFDDAHVSQYTTAAPILTSMNMVGSLAVTTRAIDTPGYMNWNQVRGLQNQGWDINAHTRTHSCVLNQADEKTITDELAGSKEDLLKKNIITMDFVTPCGVENDALKTIAKQHFRSLRTSFPGDNPIPLQDTFAIKSHALRNTTTLDEVRAWVDTAKQNKSWVILMFHQVDNSGTEYTVLPQDFREMLQVVRGSGLEVVTSKQVLDYNERL